MSKWPTNLSLTTLFLFLSGISFVGGLGFLVWSWSLSKDYEKKNQYSQILTNLEQITHLKGDEFANWRFNIIRINNERFLESKEKGFTGEKAEREEDIGLSYYFYGQLPQKFYDKNEEYKETILSDKSKAHQSLNVQQVQTDKQLFQSELTSLQSNKILSRSIYIIFFTVSLLFLCFGIFMIIVMIVMSVKKINLDIKNIATPIEKKISLEDYYRVNLSQIQIIFTFSVAAMIAGFILIIVSLLWSMFIVVNKPQNNQQFSTNYIPSVVGAVSGMIGNFIGATFLFLYKSAVEQSSKYSQFLERDNSLKLAQSLLEDIKSKAEESDDNEKIIEYQLKIITLLINQSKINEISDQSADKTK
jgi:hypothetical protein